MDYNFPFDTILYGKNETFCNFWLPKLQCEEALTVKNIAVCVWNCLIGCLNCWGGLSNKRSPSLIMIHFLLDSRQVHVVYLLGYLLSIYHQKHRVVQGKIWQQINLFVHKKDDVSKRSLSNYVKKNWNTKYGIRCFWVCLSKIGFGFFIIARPINIYFIFFSLGATMITVSRYLKWTQDIWKLSSFRCLQFA